MRAFWLGLGLMLAPVAVVRAVESSSSELPSAAPSEPRFNAIKAPYLFNMRGRRDPFINPAQWQSAGDKVFNITGLEYKGTIEVNGSSAVLFVRAQDRAQFSLRGSRLFGADGKAVPGVTGRLLPNKEVRLRQGEQTLNFSAFRAAKRKF